MTFTAWFHAARPKTLMASLCPVAVGGALAHRDGGFELVAAILALLGAMAIQIGTNLANDYFDYVQGADTAERVGPTRTVQAGWISPAAMLWATVGVFAWAALIAVCLTWRAGWPVLVIGAAGIVSGIAYTAGRYSLGYLGLGDLFVLIFFGPVAVAGTYYVQTRIWSTSAMIAGLGPGFLSVAILVVNNLRDRQQDAQAGKRTLAVRFGASFARWEYAGCIVAATVVPVWLVVEFDFPLATLAASLGNVMIGMVLVYGVWTRSGVQLNPYLGRTAAMLAAYSALLSVGRLVR